MRCAEHARVYVRDASGVLSGALAVVSGALAVVSGALAVLWIVVRISGFNYAY